MKQILLTLPIQYKVYCGANVTCYLWVTTTCGGIVKTNASGSISSSQATFNFNGYQNCIAGYDIPFTASVTLQAIPIGNDNPAHFFISADPTILLA